MKRIMKLLLGCLLLTVLLGLCVAAQADVETVTVTINVVDGATMEPVPKSLYAYHSQCVTTKYHGEDNCDCFDSLTYYWAFRNLTPCECGERWESDWTQESTGTRMLKAQHPEMETFLQGKHAALLNGADCHMPMEMAEDGTVYRGALAADESLILITEGMTLTVEYAETEHAKIRAIIGWSEKTE